MKNLRFPWLFGLLACCVMGWAQYPLIPPSSYPVQGAPFTATVETKWDSSRERHTVRILRDSAGRQRYEPVVINGKPESSTVTIYDVVAGKFIKLDTKARTAVLASMPVGHAIPIDVSKTTSLPPHVVGDGETLLGTREIAGLEAWGRRTSSTASSADGTATHDRELWLSTHYGMPVMEVLRSPAGKMTRAIVSFSPDEPDPALFRIPEGYTVSEAPAQPPPETGTLSIGGDVSAPIVLKQSAPEFSDLARRSRVNGDVVLHFIVDEQGKPQDIKVVRGLGMGLDENAVAAVKQYRFKPAMRNGVPVRVELLIQVHFTTSSPP